jgi:hypothetical protein
VVADAVWCPTVLKEIMMKLNVNVNGAAVVVNALSYAFPKKGNDLKDYTLTLNGVPAVVAKTGGGKYPTYVYLMVNGASLYLPKNVTPDAGSDVTLVAEEVKVVKVAEPVPATVVEPTPSAEPVVIKAKKQRAPKQ